MWRATCVAVVMGLLLGASTVQAEITNGDFETGDFTGWTIWSTPVPNGAIQRNWEVASAGGTPGLDPLDPPGLPPQNVYEAWNGFDGWSGYEASSGTFLGVEFRLYQDIEIPSGWLTSVSWADRLQWSDQRATARTYSVRLLDPIDDTVLKPLHFVSTGDGIDAGDTGWVSHAPIDVSEYAGQTVRLDFYLNVPLGLTGPGQYELDNVQMFVEAPEPSTFVMMSLFGVMGLLWCSKRYRHRRA